MNELEALVHSLPSHVLLVSDFNGNHPEWGSPTSNLCGNLVARLIKNQSIGMITLLSYCQHYLLSLTEQPPLWKLHKAD